MATHTHITPQTTVTIPEDLLEKLLERSESLFAVHEEIEDLYLSKNPDLIRKLREARDDHHKGHTISFDTLKQRYV